MELEAEAWLTGLKNAFRNTDSKAEKMFLLTTLPRHYWRNDRIQAEFDVSRRFVEKAMKLLEEKGPYSRPELKLVRNLPEETIKKVKKFYYSDEISRIMPGMRHNKSN